MKTATQLPNLTEADYEQLKIAARNPGVLGSLARRALAMLKAEAQSDALAPGVSPAQDGGRSELALKAEQLGSHQTNTGA